MTEDQINERNTNTWGWTDCSFLTVGGGICLSTGLPPMPIPASSAVCGPQIPGTMRPADMSDLADLNPCPLTACCIAWGHCGITQDFCIACPADTGALRTATPGSNGCIARCGMKIVNNGSLLASFVRVGYFEAWNLDRSCLYMLV
jgi:chitinase